MIFNEIFLRYNPWNEGLGRQGLVCSSEREKLYCRILYFFVDVDKLSNYVNIVLCNFFLTNIFYLFCILQIYKFCIYSLHNLVRSFVSVNLFILTLNFKLV